MRRAMSFLTGIMIGGLIGAGVILLLTPQSGQELRGTARDRFDQLVEDAREAARLRREQLERELNSLRAPRTSGGS